ncbi:glycosyltransferase family 4 protein [Methyloprofundus sp.]|uniref:glycosyltransferase family 4 protein n=1 Tax=Methyloprofundus sp. TaxID=2020875 RepID=UPI003D11A3CB
MNNKTIAIVINTSWNIYNFRLGLMQALQEEGYRIIAIAPTDSYSPMIEALGFEFHNITMNNKGTNPLEELKLIWAFCQLYKKLKPDVLLHYTIKPNIYGAIAARLNGIPVISNISGLGTVFLNDKLSSKIARYLYRVFLHIPKVVFFQNKDDRALFIDLKLVAESKADVIQGSGIDITKFSPHARKKNNKAFSFLFIARLVKDKGLMEYLEAAKIIKSKYPEVQFDVLGAFYPGNPTAITEKEMMSWQRDGIVNYLGTSDDVESIISQTDCVVLPSYREGLARVLLEAAIMSKPIVTTDVPGCRDVVVDGENGFLCQVRNVQDLADQMEKMIKLDESERGLMGQKGREKVIAEFDEKYVLVKYQSAIRHLLV